MSGVLIHDANSCSASAIAGGFPIDSVQSTIQYIVAQKIEDLKLLQHIAVHWTSTNAVEFAENISPEKIPNSAQRSTLVKALAESGPRIAVRRIAQFGVEEERDRVEIAKICAQESAYDLTYYLPSFRIANKEEHFSVVKICAMKNGPAVIQNLSSLLDGASQEQRLEILNICLESCPFVIPLYISDFEIDDPSERAKIALLCAKKCPHVLPEHILKFNIEEERTRATIALQCAERSPGTLAKSLSNFRIESLEHRTAILKKCAERDPGATFSHLVSFDISNQQTLIDLAAEYIQKSPAETAANIRNFQIQNPEERFKIAHLCATHHPRVLALHKEQFDIQNPHAGTELAISCVKRDPSIIAIPGFLARIREISDYRAIAAAIGDNPPRLDEQTLNIPEVRFLCALCKLSQRIRLRSSLPSHEALSKAVELLTPVLRNPNFELASKLAFCLAVNWENDERGDYGRKIESSREEPWQRIQCDIILSQWGFTLDQLLEKTKIRFKYLKNGENRSLHGLLTTALELDKRRGIWEHRKFELLALSLQSKECADRLHIALNNMPEKLFNLPLDIENPRELLEVSPKYFAKLFHFQENWDPLIPYAKLPRSERRAWNLERFAAGLNADDPTVWEQMRILITRIALQTHETARYEAKNDEHLRWIEKNHPEVFQGWQTSTSIPLDDRQELVNSDSWEDLLLSGTEQPTCLHLQTGPWRACLLPLMINGMNRILILRNKGDKKIIARALFRLVLDEQNLPALFLETPYPSELHNSSLLTQFAQKEAKRLDLPLYLSGPGSTHLKSLPTSVPFGHSDAMRGAQFPAPIFKIANATSL